MAPQERNNEVSNQKLEPMKSENRTMTVHTVAYGFFTSDYVTVIVPAWKHF